MSPFWLLRMRRWLQHPPPMARVVLVACVVALCLGLFAIERWVGWPDWLTVERARFPPRF